MDEFFVFVPGLPSFAKSTFPGHGNGFRNIFNLMRKEILETKGDRDGKNVLLSFRALTGRRC